MLGRLRALSERARESALSVDAQRFPPRVKRFFTTISGYEPAEFVARLIPPHAKTILVVGVGAGRDSYWLRSKGLNVRSIDIVEQENIPDLVIADMVAIPFRAGTFDAVVVADALEHTIHDFEAVSEFHRVCHASGRLILNVPYGDDVGEHHVRVYTADTLRRLLASAGFEIREHVFRGAFPIVEQVIPGARGVLHAAGIAAHVAGKNVYSPILNAFTNYDWSHGSRATLRQHYRGHGAYISAAPSEHKVDYRAVNSREYRNQARSMYRELPES